MTTRTTADKLLKEFYLGPIREQLNSSNLLMRRLEKREDIVEGREVVMPLHIGRNVGTLAVAEGGDLPDAGYQQYEDTRFFTRYNYGQIHMTGPLMASARSKRGAFVRAMDAEVKGVVRDLKQDINRQLFGDGSGRLAVLSSSSGAPTLSVQEPQDTGNQAASFRRIHVGDRLALEDISSTGLVPLDGSNYVEVTAVDLQAKTVTFAAVSASLSVGDGLVKGASTSKAVANANSSFRGQSGGSALASKEMMGLVGICSGANGWTRNAALAYSAVPAGQVYAGSATGTAVFANVQNLDATTGANAFWRANMFFNNGVPRAVSADLLQQGLDASEVNGQAVPSIGITSYAGRRKLVDMLAADRRFVGAQAYTLDGGYKAIDYNGVPFVPEKDCPEGALFLLPEEHLMIARMSDFYWLDKDGAVFSRVQGVDAWEATLAYYAELCTDRRNVFTVIGDMKVA